MTGEPVIEEQIRSPRALFARRFTELYEAAGNPTLRRVAAAAETRMRAAAGARPGGASAQRISDWKAGRNVPARFESLLPVVLTLTDLARKAGAPLTRELAEPREWQRLWQSATTWNPEADTEAACPYPGLTSYGRDNSALFFGRTRATAELADLVRTATGLVAVVGASGAGKSSLLAAGLAPALGDWATTIFTPGGHPMAQLADIALTPRTAGPRRLLIVDQFEELFTTCADEHEREDFLARLHECATRADDPIAVVVALRADFYAHCLNHLILQDALEHRSYLLGPMRLDELSQAISGPARAVGLELEPGLEELVITELCGAGDHHGRRTYDPGALPLLSHVMAATWQHREGRRLTSSGYRTAGGVVGSVTETAEQAWTELSDTQRSAAHDILLGLVAVGQDARDTRRPAQRTDLLRRVPDTEAATAALELLSRTRLITLDAEAVTLTHEIVLTAWPRLREWINEDRVGYLVRQRLETDAAEWAAQERDPSLLYRGTRLQNAVDNVDPPPVGPLAREFLTAATAARDHTRRRSTRSKAILAILGVALLVLGFAAYTQTRLVDQQRADKNFADILAAADRVRTTDPSVAAQLDLIAWRTRPGDQRVLSRLLQSQNIPLVTEIAAHELGISKVRYRQGGGVLASLALEGVLRLWNTTDPQHPKALSPRFDAIADMEFSPNGELLATVSELISTGTGSAPKFTITLWNVSTPEEPRLLTTLPQPPGSESHVAHVVFAPDGRTLVVNDTSSLALWNIGNPSSPALLSTTGLHDPDTISGLGEITISPDGRLLALVHKEMRANSKVVQLWNISDPVEPALLTTTPGGPDDTVTELEFGPDNRILAIGKGIGSIKPVGNNNATVTLWDITDPGHARSYAVIPTDLTTLYALDFAPDGRMLAIGGAGNTTLWSVSDPANPVRLTDYPAPSAAVCRYEAQSFPCQGGSSTIAFAPDGRTMATGTWGGALRLWSLPPAVLTGHSGAVAAPAFDATGSRMVTSSGDGLIVVWDLRNRGAPRRIGEYRLPPDFRQVTMSPDGATVLVTARTHDTAPLVLDTSDPARIRPLGEWRLPLERLGGLAISADWTMLATANDDDSLQLWDLSDRSRPIAIGTGWPIRASLSTLRFSADNKTVLTREWVSRYPLPPEVVYTLWNIADPAHPVGVAELLRRTGTPEELHLTPDWQIMVVSNDATMQSWDVSDPTRPVKLGAPFTLGNLTSRGLVFTGKNSETMLATGDDGTAQLWDFSDPAHPVRGGTLAEAGAHPWKATVHPDGSHIAAGSDDSGIRLWDLDEEHAIDRICAATGDMWTEELWQRYLPADRPFDPPCD
ncbi:WD40 repeat domain-containing protein [Nocardia sp. NPDC003693]